MGRIFCLMGKSSTGKDTMYRRICEDEALSLRPMVLYTTRPIREGETEGLQYHFTDAAAYDDFVKKGLLIESRTYHTVHGDWIYFNVDDGSVDLSDNSYVTIGTLESYKAFADHYGKENVIPIYIEVEDGERLQRALRREMKPENHKYQEMCRRFLADCEDFSEEKITESGIRKENRFNNVDRETTYTEIKNYILSLLK